MPDSTTSAAPEQDAQPQQATATEPISPEAQQALASYNEVRQRFGEEPVTAAEAAPAGTSAPEVQGAMEGAEPTRGTEPQQPAEPVQPEQAQQDGEQQGGDHPAHQRWRRSEKVRTLEARNHQLEQALRDVVPRLQQMEQAGQQAPAPAPEAELPDPALDPDGYFEARLAQELGPIRERLSAQDQQEQAQKAQHQAIQDLNQLGAATQEAEDEYAASAEGQGYHERMGEYHQSMRTVYAKVGAPPRVVDQLLAAEAEGIARLADNFGVNPGWFADQMVLTLRQQAGVPAQPVARQPSAGEQRIGHMQEAARSDVAANPGATNGRPTGSGNEVINALAGRGSMSEALDSMPGNSLSEKADALIAEGMKFADRG